MDQHTDNELFVTIALLLVLGVAVLFIANLVGAINVFG
jgi:hypothetical protein